MQSSGLKAPRLISGLFLIFAVIVSPLTAMAQRTRTRPAAPRLARYTIKGVFNEKLDENESHTHSKGEMTLSWEISETIAIAPPAPDEPDGGFIGVANPNRAANGGVVYNYEMASPRVNSSMSFTGGLSSNDTDISLPRLVKSFPPNPPKYVKVDFRFSFKVNGNCKTTVKDRGQTMTVNQCSPAWSPLLRSFSKISESVQIGENSSAILALEMTLKPQPPETAHSGDPAEQSELEMDRNMAAGTEHMFSFQLYGADTHGSMLEGFVVRLAKKGKSVSGGEASLDVTAQIKPQGATALLVPAPGQWPREVADKKRVFA
jgi:hypothetical protein